MHVRCAIVGRAMQISSGRAKCKRTRCRPKICASVVLAAVATTGSKRGMCAHPCQPTSWCDSDEEEAVFALQRNCRRVAAGDSTIIARAKPPNHLRFNLTPHLDATGHGGRSPWLLRVSNAVAEVTDAFLLPRVACDAASSGPTTSPRLEAQTITGQALDTSQGDRATVKPITCEELLASAGVSWCTFLRRLDSIVKFLPAAGRVRSALNMSAADVIQSALPKALSVPLMGLADGRKAFMHAVQATQNATMVFLHFIECAMLLGGEALTFGFERVARARFHGEAGNVGVAEGWLNQADVLLWALARQYGARAASSEMADSRAVGPGPTIVELGVNRGITAARLLASHPKLRWLGVDPYKGLEGMIWAGPQPVRRAEEVFREAVARLQPWLQAGRARLLRARSTEVSEQSLSDELMRMGTSTAKPQFEMVFVDADHSRSACAADIKVWMSRVRRGGLVAGHDYATNYAGVVEAVHAAIPRGVTLHLGPCSVFWWKRPRAIIQ